ncbi:MAG TPA: hypothetical protein VMC43_01835 [Candidatus Paceibacterota bacterium]|nr:hypothetical protein [Candidatus Paceibacterota bacterium]
MNTETLKKILARLLAFLRVRSIIAGLEIGDTVLRYAVRADGVWQFASLRLPPGIIEDGKVKDYKQFVEALGALRAQIVGPQDKRSLVNVVVSLSSINIYSQVFSLPMIEGENLEKAIQLNIQMVSPGEAAQTYSGWQMVGQDQRSVRLEILSAFINRTIADDMKRALKEAGFVVYSLESRALSLARAVRQLAAGFDPTRSYIVLNLDSNGLEFLVLRQGQLYFQYFNPWQDFQGPERQISQEAFENIVTRNLHQVLNFYNSHWSDPVMEILVAASGLQDEVIRVVTQNFPLVIQPLTLSLSPDVGPDWFVALGSGLRGLIPRRDDKDISLLGVSAQEEFRHHQMISFLEFWRVVVPVSLVILILAFVGADTFLSWTTRSLDKKINDAAALTPEAAQLGTLQARVDAFNQMVGFIKTTRQNAPNESALLETIEEMLAAHNATVQRVVFQGYQAGIKVMAQAKSTDDIQKLNQALDADPRFHGVDIPFPSIQQNQDGVSFLVTFSMDAPKAP